MSDFTRLAEYTKSRLGGSRVTAIVAGWHAADPRCTSCGLETRLDVPNSHPRKATFGHLVSAETIKAATGVERGGYTADNGVLQCVTCQHDRARCGNPDFSLSDLSFIPAYLGTFPRGNARRNETAEYATLAAESRAARRW